MDPPSLDDARNKLRWASQHFELLSPPVQAFQKRDAHSFSVEIDANVGKYTFHVHGLEDPDPRWGLIAGDCLHNARSALDYVMVRLFALVTAEQPSAIGNVQFPIVDRPDKFPGAKGISEAKKHPAFSGYLTRIEELQPYNVGNPSIWGTGRGGVPNMHSLPPALERLSALDNIDKHQIIHAAWSGIDMLQSIYNTPVDPPNGFQWNGASTSVEPLKDGAEVGYWQFMAPLPGKWEPTQVEMKRAFPPSCSHRRGPRLSRRTRSAVALHVGRRLRPEYLPARLR